MRQDLSNLKSYFLNTETSLENESLSCVVSLGLWHVRYDTFLIIQQSAKVVKPQLVLMAIAKTRIS